MNEEVRVRFAPSPTGKFHIGSARTALFNYLYAKKFGGKFILRIEDTDKKRSTKEYYEDIINNLKWLGIMWDEGPLVDGPYGPYRQSERTDKYQNYIDLMLQNGQAYYCYCSAEELEKEKAEQMKRHEAPRYSGKCRGLTQEQMKKYKAEGRKPVIKFKVSDDKVKFTDLIRGEIEFDMKLFGDFTIVSSEGQPFFLLANTVDDVLMKITHVLRGEDHLSNTPKQILLFEALNFMPPSYGHLPMILNPDKTKMSKRNDPTSVTDDFKEKGFLAEALVNFMALLGWAPGDDQELFSLHDLEMEFSLAKVGKSPAIFNWDKLLHLNGYYIRQMDLGDLAESCRRFLERDNPAAAKIASNNNDYYLQVVALLQERLKRLDEISEYSKFFFADELDYEPKLLITKGSDKNTTVTALEKSLVELRKIDKFENDDLEKTLRAVATQNNISAGQVLWPVRAAITGQIASPGVFDVLTALGRDRSLRRIETAIEKLK